MRGCWRLKPQVGYLHSFLLENPDNFCQTLTPRPISTFEGKKGEQKIEKTISIQTQKNTINITHEKSKQTQTISHTISHEKRS